MNGWFLITPLAIELGDLRLSHAASATEIAWFVGGLFLLTGLSWLVLRWNRHARPDPFL